MRKENVIYEITVRNFPDNRVMVSKVLDPMFDAKLLLEGVGCLVKEIVATSKLPNNGWVSTWQNLNSEEVIKRLQDYLGIIGNDYKDIVSNKNT